MKFELIGGKVTSTGGWTPTGVYGVSKDGTTLVVDHGSSKFTLEVLNKNQADCLTLSESSTGDEYEICKVN